MPTKATLSPFHNFVLLKEIPTAGVIGSIIIPDAHRAKLNQGEVVDKGPLVSDLIQNGQILFFPLHSEHRLEWKGNKFILIAEDQVLGSISEIVDSPEATKEAAPLKLVDAKP